MCTTFTMALDTLGIICTDTRINEHYKDGSHKFRDEGGKLVLAPCGWITGTGCWTVLQGFYEDLLRTGVKTWPEIESLLRSARERAVAELRDRGMDVSDADKVAIFFLDEEREPGALFAQRFDFRQTPPGEARKNGYYFSWPPDLPKKDELELLRQFDRDVNSPRGPAQEMAVACNVLRLVGRVFAEASARSRTASGTLDAGIVLRDGVHTHRFGLTVDANRLSRLSDDQIWALASSVRRPDQQLKEEESESVSTRPEAAIRKISADIGAITAGILTGTVVRTASSGARIELDSTNGLQAIDSLGNVRVKIPTSGDLIEFRSHDTTPGKIVWKNSAGTAKVELYGNDTNTDMHWSPLTDQAGNLYIGEPTVNWQQIFFRLKGLTGATSFNVAVKQSGTSRETNIFAGDKSIQLVAWNGATTPKANVIVDAGALTAHHVLVQLNDVDHFEVTLDPADGETAILVRRNVGGTRTLQRVSMGATDSGGTGFKLLRVPN